MSTQHSVQAASGLLAGRTVLLTGVLRPSSIAASIAAAAHDQGARVILTAVPRTLALTGSVAGRLGLSDPPVPLDVTDPSGLAALPGRLAGLGVVDLDGIVHAIAHAGPELLGRILPGATRPPARPTDATGLALGAGEDPRLLAQTAEAIRAGREPGAPEGQGGLERARDLERAFTTSTASLPALVGALLPLLSRDASVVALSFDTSRIHPGYGWMGPLKAALEASVRSLAVELGPSGIRVNALSTGPLRTPAASAIPDFELLANKWVRRAPLGWDPDDAEAVARSAVVLLSNWLPATTGQVIRADGGAGLLDG